MKVFKAFITIAIVFILFLSLSTYSSISKLADSSEYWMGIYSGDKRVGYSYHTVKNRNGLTEVSDVTIFKVNLLGKDMDVKNNAVYILEGYKILEFEYEMVSDSVNLKASGKRNGKELEVTMETISGETTRTIEIDQELILPSLVAEIVANSKFKTGDKYQFKLFEPLYLLMGLDEASSTHKIEEKETIWIKDKKYEAYKVLSNIMGSEITSWINESGEILKQEFPPSLTSIRETKENILSSNYTSFDIIEETSIPSAQKLKNSEKLQRLKVKVQGIDIDDGFDINDGYRQNLDGNILEIKSGSIPEPEYSLPNNSKKLSIYVEDEFLIQSKDREIRELSDKIIGDETNPLEAAEKINKWIYKNLEKSATASLPNAKDVLKTRVGDCNEHAILFTAMARSVGIPTKTVLGIMYLDERFVYHAWNEVYMGDWVAVDSTFGQFPADATHIKLIEGNLARSGEISKVVGKLNIEIIDAT